jgi:glycerol-3-phosphate dehydrogenase
MNRASQIETLNSTEVWDVIIVGGGATGLGACVEAASRGLKTLLIEQYDFGKGTSSKATKLVHGGVRYLAQGNIALVIEALKERGILLKNAPHLSRVQPFIIPCYSFFKWCFYGIGLKVYDILAGKRGLGNTKMIKKASVVSLLKEVATKNLVGGVLYTDGQFDDTRLAINLAQTAVELGATVINYMPLNAFTFNDNNISGITCTDALNNTTYTLNAKAVINATGVFADTIMHQAKDYSTKIAPSQGVHLVVNNNFFSSTTALMIPKTTDGRVLFAVPWHNKVIIGTTDTPVNKANIEPQALEEEINFIINNFNAYTTIPITKKDVQSIFTGLRPLVKKEGVKSTAALNRNHAVIVSPSKLITITGGKWTTYRKMGEDAINNVFYLLKLPKVKSITQNITIHGGTINNKANNSVLNIYGSDVVNIEKLINDDKSLGAQLHPNYEYTLAQVVWAIDQEMAMNIEDVLARRIRLLFLDAKAAIEAAPKVAALLQMKLNKNNDWANNEIELFTSLANKYLLK